MRTEQEAAPPLDFDDEDYSWSLFDDDDVFPTDEDIAWVSHLVGDDE